MPPPCTSVGAEIIPVGIDDQGLLDIKEALEQLAKRGITRLLVEGGPSVAQVFLDADLGRRGGDLPRSNAGRQRRASPLCRRRT